jgi:RNA polymerase sigma-70 factor (sigma-E family)
MMATVPMSSGEDDQPENCAPTLHDLYLQHRLSLLRLASLLLHEVGDAEEVVQEAFVAAHLKWDQLRDPERALPYLRSAVLNGARSRLRHRRVVARAVPARSVDEHAAEVTAVANDERRRMIAALRALPTRQRECLALRFYLDLSEAEIARTLGISPGSVKTHVHRGLATLAERLKVAV